MMGARTVVGIFAEEYAQKDTRVQVVHKENGGLSDAEMRGSPIQKATM